MRNLNTLLMMSRSSMMMMMIIYTRSNVVSSIIVMTALFRELCDCVALISEHCLTLSLKHFMTLSLVLTIVDQECLNSTSWFIFLQFVSPVLVSMSMDNNSQEEHSKNK